MKNLIRLLLAVTLLSGLCSLASAADEPKLTTTEVKDGLYVISGDGGNMAFLNGPEGGFLIDDAYANSAPRIFNQLKKLGAKAPKFLANTHYHGDHAGSNLSFGEAGSIIIGHRNVRARLAEGTEIKTFNMVTPPVKPEGLPSITYTDAIDLYINGETISFFHVENAHTDGDTIMKFIGRNVIHTGDVLFNGFFPFIDTDHGGTLVGYIKAQKSIIDLADENTIVIPGHGEVTDRAGVIRNREMLKSALMRLVEARKAGKSLEQVITDNPLADLDAEWGQAMFTSDRWISIVYKSVKAADEWCCINE